MIRRLALGLALLLLAAAPAAAQQDPGNYGPDWPTCQNLDAEPRTEIDACNRLIDAGVLSTRHLSWALNDRGSAWAHLGRADLAGADFSKAIATDPANHAPYYNLGGLELELGRYGDALTLFDKLVALKPDLADGHCRRAKALFGLHRIDEAMDEYRVALAKERNNACAIANLFDLARANADYDEIIKVLDAALQDDPNNAENHHLRGLVYQDLQQYDRALADLDAAVSLNPGNNRALAAIGVTYMQMDQLDRALQAMTQAIAINPNDWEGYAQRAHLLFRLEDYKAAIADCTSVLAIEPRHGPCRRLQTEAAMMLGDFHAAERYASNMAAVGKSDGLLYRGVAQLAAGDVDGAATDLAAYTATLPEDPYGWLWVYLADRQRGRNDAAKLKELAARRDAWPTMVIRYAVGAATAAEVLESVDVPDPDLKKQRTAEANYYLGVLAALDGDQAGAEAAFKAALAVGVASMDPKQAIPVYKNEDILELAMAKAALAGGGL